jgi:hypothetical protein
LTGDVINDPLLTTNIKNALSQGLQKLGYHQNAGNPNLLVQFIVLVKPTRLDAFERFTGNLKNVIGKTTDHTTAAFNVDPGTLLISFIEPNSKKVIWQGFASGLIDCQATKNNILLVDEAVRLILQEFTYQIENNSPLLD